ncbi:MAG: CpsB/CapC family capsule biosynthesis tyrosine phosphatase [Lachnospiraceae bacterium]
MEENFIDIHSHILPVIDDGALNMDETMKMLEQACINGTSDLIATSHYNPGRNYVNYEKQNEIFLKVQEIAEKQYGIRLYSGNELYYFEECIPLIEKGNIKTLAESRYLLLEFSPFEEYDRMFNAVQTLQSEGYWVILAHVERYAVLRDINKLERLTNQGAYIQINVQTISGKGNWKRYNYVKKLMAKNLLHFVASDAHDSVKRTANLKTAFAMIERRYSYDCAEQIMRKNPKCILENRFL